MVNTSCWLQIYSIRFSIIRIPQYSLEWIVRTKVLLHLSVRLSGFDVWLVRVADSIRGTNYGWLSLELCLGNVVSASGHFYIFKYRKVQPHCAGFSKLAWSFVFVMSRIYFASSLYGHCTLRGVCIYPLHILINVSIVYLHEYYTQFNKTSVMLLNYDDSDILQYLL